MKNTKRYKESLAMADEIKSVTDFAVGTLIRKLADAHIKHGYGYYTFIEGETGKKIFVQ